MPFGRLLARGDALREAPAADERQRRLRAPWAAGRAGSRPSSSAPAPAAAPASRLRRVSAAHVRRSSPTGAATHVNRTSHARAAGRCRACAALAPLVAVALAVAGVVALRPGAETGACAQGDPVVPRADCDAQRRRPDARALRGDDRSRSARSACARPGAACASRFTRRVDRPVRDRRLPDLGRAAGCSASAASPASHRRARRRSRWSGRARRATASSSRASDPRRARPRSTTRRVALRPPRRALPRCARRSTARTSCATLTSFKLERPAFGGRAQPRARASRSASPARAGDGRGAARRPRRPALRRRTARRAGVTHRLRLPRRAPAPRALRGPAALQRATRPRSAPRSTRSGCESHPAVHRRPPGDAARRSSTPSTATPASGATPTPRRSSSTRSRSPCCCATAGYDDEVVAAGLLHDAIEDTDATPEDLRERFGDARRRARRGAQRRRGDRGLRRAQGGAARAGRGAPGARRWRSTPPTRSPRRASCAPSSIRSPAARDDADVQARLEHYDAQPRDAAGPPARTTRSCASCASSCGRCARCRPRRTEQDARLRRPSNWHSRPPVWTTSVKAGRLPAE